MLMDMGGKVTYVPSERNMFEVQECEEDGEKPPEADRFDAEKSKWVWGGEGHGGG